MGDVGEFGGGCGIDGDTEAARQKFLGRRSDEALQLQRRAACIPPLQRLSDGSLTAL